MKHIGNFVIDNLNSALATWNEKLTEIWSLITTAPEDFLGGAIWYTIVSVNGALRAIAYALLTLFFVMGVMKTTGSFVELKRPETAFKVFIRFACANGAITYSLQITNTLFKICQSAVNTIIGASGLTTTMPVELPDRMADLIEDVSLLESCIIVLACIIFSKFASTSPTITDDTLAPAAVVWNYIGQLLFNMLVLVSTVKMSSQFVRELMGL